VRPHSNCIIANITANIFFFFSFNQNYYTAYLKGHHTAKTHESRTDYAQIFVSVWSSRGMRNSSVDRTWTFSEWKWMCVEAGLCVISSFERLKKNSDAQLHVRRCGYSWVGVRSLCVEYARLCAGHASAVSGYASELVRNRARPHPSTDAPPSYHAWTAHVSRLSRNESSCT